MNAAAASAIAAVVGVSAPGSSSARRSRTDAATASASAARPSTSAAVSGASISRHVAAIVSEPAWNSESRRRTLISSGGGSP